MHTNRNLNQEIFLNQVLKNLIVKPQLDLILVNQDYTFQDNQWLLIMDLSC